MLKFNTLLQEAGFDLEKVKVFLLRHEDKRAPIELYQAWKSVPEDFEAYQSNQKWKNRFPKGSYLAAFVVGPEGETLFVGMYEVLKLSRTNEPFIDPLLGPMEADDRSFHEIKRSDKMQDYVEKLVIEWGPGKLAWRQHAKEQNKTILEVRPRLKEPPFPGYIDFLCCIKDIKNIWCSWQPWLEKSKGVYLLAFEDGMQYVGSATGELGFWQRWNDYLRNGHGGNKVLIRDRHDARVATVSILETSGSNDTHVMIIGREMLWQRKLGTRAKRLGSEGTLL